MVKGEGVRREVEVEGGRSWTEVGKGRGENGEFVILSRINK